MTATSLCSINSLTFVLHHTTARPVFLDRNRSTYDATGFLDFPHLAVRRKGGKCHSILKDANASLMGKNINIRNQIKHTPPFMVYSIQGDGKSTSENVANTKGRSLGALDSYFGKLQRDLSGHSATSKNGSEFHVKSTDETNCEMNMDVNENNRFKANAGLGSLDSYFDKLDIGEYFVFLKTQIS